MPVKGPDEVGPPSCQKADVAGGQLSPGNGAALLINPVTPFQFFSSEKKKKKSRYAGLIPISLFHGFCSSVFASIN